MASFTQMEWIWLFHWQWKPSSGNFSSLQTKFNYLLKRSVVTITLCSGEMLHSQEQHHRTPIWWRRYDSDLLKMQKVKKKNNGGWEEFKSTCLLWDKLMASLWPTHPISEFNPTHLLQAFHSLSRAARCFVFLLPNTYSARRRAFLSLFKQPPEFLSW